MLKKLSTLRAKRAQSDKGFTLIELLVVVVILGILIAIAIPLYLNYRKGANDSSAKSDLRNAVNVLEQCNTDGGKYPSVVTTAGAMTGCTGAINLSDGTTVNYFPVSVADPTNYIMTSTNSNGATKFYCYASAAGGAVVSITPDKGAYAASC